MGGGWRTLFAGKVSALSPLDTPHGKMDKIIARYGCISNLSVISQSTLISAKKPVLHHDQPHWVLLPLVPHEQGAALVVVVIQPLTSSEWPGCVFFAVAIREIHCCCIDADVLEAVREQIGSTIGRVYAQITVDVSKALQKAPVFQLPIAW